MIAIRRPVICVLVLFLATSGYCDEPGRPDEPGRRVPDYNVEDSRLEFYDLLNKKEQELMQNFRYDSDGRVIRDEVYEAGFEEFQQFEEQLRDEFMSRRGRDDALVEIFEAAEIDPEQRKQLFSDTGSAPTERLGGPKARDTADAAPITGQDTQTYHRDVKSTDTSDVPTSAIDRGKKDFYRGDLGDRDITAKSPEMVAEIESKAREMGYTVRKRNGYIKIDELDTIVWEEGSDAHRLYLQDRASFRARLDDPEFVAGGKDAGAIQQVSKVQKQFGPGQPPGSDVPDRMRSNLQADRLAMKRAEFAQNLGKSGFKTDEMLIRRGAATVTTDETRKKLRRLAHGEDPRVVLKTFGEKNPEFVDKELIRLRDEDVVQVLKDGINADHQARADHRKLLANRNRELLEGITEAKENGNVLDQRCREAEFEDNQRRIKQLEQIDNLEYRTRDVLIRKNAQIRRKVFDIHGDSIVRLDADDPDSPGGRRPADSPEARPTDSSPGASNTRTGDSPRSRFVGAKTLGAKYGGDAVSLLTRWAEESARAESEGRPVSQARIAVLVAADLTEISDVYEGLSGLANETTTGTSDYIRDQLRNYERAGVDTSKFSFRAALALKASLRGTVLGTWQGCKALPGVNQGINAAEGIYAIGSAGSESAREQEHTAFVEEFNRITQSDNRDAALVAAKQLAARVQSLHQSFETLSRTKAQIDREMSGMLDRVAPLSKPLHEREEAVWNVVEAARKLHVEGNFSHLALFDRLDASITRFNTITSQADEARGAIEARRMEMSTAKATFEGLNQGYSIAVANHADTVKAANGVIALGEGLDGTHSMSGLIESIQDDIDVVAEVQNCAKELLRSYRQVMIQQMKIQPVLMRSWQALNRGLDYFRKESIRRDAPEIARQLAGLEAVLKDTQVSAPVREFETRDYELQDRIAAIGTITRDLRTPPESGFEKFDLYVELAREASGPLKQSANAAGVAARDAEAALKRLREALGAMDSPVVKASPPARSSDAELSLGFSFMRSEPTSDDSFADLANRPYGIDGYFHMSVNNRTGAVEATISSDAARLIGPSKFDGLDDQIAWALAWVDMKGKGRLDVRTGRFQVQFHTDEGSTLSVAHLSPGKKPTHGSGVGAGRDERYVKILGGSGESIWKYVPGGRQAALKALGFDPRRVTATVTGRVDLERSGGSAEVRIGSLPPETWKSQDSGCVGFSMVSFGERSHLRKYRNQVRFAGANLSPTVADAAAAARGWRISDTLTVDGVTYDYGLQHPEGFPHRNVVRLRVGRVVLFVQMQRGSLPLKEIYPEVSQIFQPFVKAVREAGLDHD